MSGETAITGVNDHGTPVTIFTCRACGHEVSVCPAIPLEDFDRLWGYECTGDNCPSYDIARDIGIFFEAAQEAGLIRRGGESR